ncbi:MAG: MipA/OmpV family protein [Proteobacteria bacterium]|nr:MipA/OmpV family protein [Pseudomonadota bacterium]
MQRSFPMMCFLLLAAGALAQPTRADPSADDCRSVSADCVAVGHWNFSLSLGAGVRTNPLAGRSDIPLIVIPQISYYSTRFFIDNLDVGFTLLERPAYSLNLFASPGYDRVYFSLHDPQNVFGAVSGTGTNNAPPAVARSIAFTYLGGVEWIQKYRSADIQFDLLHDITGHHDGTEVRAALGLPLWQATGTVTADIGFTWKSAEIVNYYYGVPGIYHGGSALNPFIKLACERPISAHWKLKAFVHGERLGEAIAASPIVAQRYVTTVFAGANYTF